MSVFIDHYKSSYIISEMTWIFLREIIIWTFTIWNINVIIATIFWSLFDNSSFIYKINLFWKINKKIVFIDEALL